MQQKHIIQEQLTSQFKLRLIWQAILVGGMSGFLAVAYRFVLQNLVYARDYIFDSDIWWVKLIFFISLIPLSLVVAKLLQIAPLSGGSGIPQIKAELLGRVDVKPKQTIFSKFVGGSINNFMGLSLGREGPSIQLGGTSAKMVAQLFKRDRRETNYLMSAGASAGLSAAFNAPVAGTIFALEELYGSLSRFVLIPCLLSSIVANYVSFNLMGMTPAFSFTINESMPLNQFHWIIIIGIFAGLVGGLFNISLEKLRQMIAKKNISTAARIFIAAAVTFVIGHFAYDILGGGHHLVEEMAINNYSLISLIVILGLKLFLTIMSFDSGAQGGIFLPVLVLGAATGLICFKLVLSISSIEAYAVNFMIMGMAAVLAAVVRAPLMSIILVTEMTGSFSQMLNITIAVIVAYIVVEKVKIVPVYDTLYHNLIERLEKNRQVDVKKTTDFMVSYFTIKPEFKDLNRALEAIDLSANYLIIEIEREGDHFMPGKDDKLQLGDHITVLHDHLDSELIVDFFNS